VIHRDLKKEKIRLSFSFLFFFSFFFSSPLRDLAVPSLEDERR